MKHTHSEAISPGRLEDTELERSVCLKHTHTHTVMSWATSQSEGSSRISVRNYSSSN